MMRPTRARVLALILVLLSAGSSAACQGLLVYDRVLGGVSAVGVSTRISTFEVIADQPIFLPDNVSPNVILPPFDVISPTKLFVLKTDGFERLDFGPVLPPNLNGADLSFSINGSSVCAATYFRLIVEDADWPGDFDGDRAYTLNDIEILQWASGRYARELDVNGDLTVDGNDVTTWVREQAGSWIGDANLDGLFNSSDLVQVMAADQFEARWPRADWSTGDWNADRRFNTEDLVVAFLDGGYERGRRPLRVVPEPSGFLPALFGVLAITLARAVRGTGRGKLQSSGR